MIATVNPAPVKPATHAAPGAGVSASDSGFARLLAPDDGAEGTIEPRQKPAGDGKDLPDNAGAGDGWLALIGATVVPTAPTTPTSAATPASVPTLPPPVLVLDPLAAATPGTPVGISETVPVAPALPHVTATPDGAIAPLPVPATRADAGARSAAEPVADIVTAHDTSPLPSAVTPPTAAQVVAVMAERPVALLQGLTAATRTVPLSPSVSERERAGEIRADGTIQLPLVAAAIETHRTMLDLRQEHWPQRMVEHIETLRDAANAADTRIRLVPDALGTVDVQLRREGETVHVAFAADRAETRALLDHAQPKLAELGEARGLRFAQSGAGQHGQNSPRPAPEPAVPAAPRRAESIEETSDDASTRIA